MNLNVNSIYQSKLNEIQSRIPNISDKTSGFSECLKKATAETTTTTPPTETTTENNNTTDALSLLSLLSSTSMYNNSNLFSDSTTTNSLSNLSTLLALQQYK